jgi:hypothetical protein
MTTQYLQNNECVSKIHEQTNTRIYDRNIPSQLLQPYLDVRPVMTKYSYFPIVDPRRELDTKLMQMPTYNVHTIFNPGNTQSPWSGFASNVNVESELIGREASQISLLIFAAKTFLAKPSLILCAI